MKKEVIVEYKETFDWWVKSGSIWVKYKYADESTNWIKHTSCNDLDIHWDKVYYNGKQEICYVQNDSYSDLRKAQADGKVIQYNAHCHPERSGIWRRDTELNWHFPAKQYRIKPEPPKFKVGDWVRNNKITSWIRQLKKKDLNAYNGMEGCVNLGKEFELWEPQEGEWVTVWQDKWVDNYQIKRYSNLISYTNIAPLEFAQTLKDKS